MSVVSSPVANDERIAVSQPLQHLKTHRGSVPGGAKPMDVRALLQQ